MRLFQIDRKAMRFSNNYYGINVFWRDLIPFVGRGFKFWYHQFMKGIGCLKVGDSRRLNE